MKIRTILEQKNRPVITLRPEDTVQTAATLLTTNKIGAMPVRSAEGKLVGIFSERDIVRGFANQPSKVLNLTVADLMTKHVLTCTPDDEVKDVLEIMHEKRIRHMPVMNGDDLVGVVSQGDVVKQRLEHTELETQVLREYALARG